MSASMEREPGPSALASPGYQRLVETFAQVVWEADAAGRLLPGSLSRPTLAGQPEGAGFGWLDVVHPEDRSEVERAWRRSVAEGSVYRQEYRARWDGRGYVWTLAHAVPTLDEHGRPLRWLGMNVDISARKGAQQALQEAEQQKDQFISVLAHELRNPLAPLRSGIDLLSSETATAASKARALTTMGRQISHISRLVEDLIDASRITTGKLRVHLEERVLADIVRAAVEGIQPALDAKRQRLTIEGFDRLDPVVNADAVRLNQAFGNVLNNSAKFSPENSAIRIIVERHDERVSVTVRDQGRPIPEDDLPNIFKLFVQSARHDPGDGLGIGMALASDIVKLHGGTLRARTAAGDVGAEFEIDLPVVAFDAAERTGAATEEGKAAFEALRVLVVDDNLDAGETLGALLELACHTVRIAHDGLEAVDEAAVFLPHVIFMDLGLPVLSGAEATTRIRALQLPVRPFIVALTGWTSEVDRKAARDAGCDMHLGKPADLGELMAALERSVAVREGMR